MIKNFCRSITLIATLCAMASVADAQFWNLGADRTVSGLSGDGSFAAGTSGSGFFYWTPGGGSVDVGGNSNAGQAKVSNDGTRFSGSLANPASGLIEMAYYEIGSGWTGLGGIGGPCASDTSSGWGISGDGSKVVGLGWLTCSSAHAIQWTQSDGTTDIGSTVAGRSSRANQTNLDGTIVVGWQDGTTGFRQGAVWANGVQTLLTSPNGNLSEASDVSADGHWIVGNGNSSTGFNGWRWDRTDGTAAGYQDLGRPAGVSPAWRGASTSISADGSKIVGFYRPFPGPPTFGRGYLWDNGSIVDLNDYVASFGIDTQGVTLALPLDISADGTTIAGLGSGGVGFVVRVPEPSSALAVGLALVAALSWVRPGRKG